MCFKIPFKFQFKSIDSLWEQLLECFGLNEESNPDGTLLSEIVVMSPKTEMGFEIINNTM